jgi:hypothetical protein
MDGLHFSPVPAGMLVSAGGVTRVSPEPWARYLDAQLQRLFPAYWRRRHGAQPDTRWRENACILEALEQYLLARFGIALPEDNLFKVYNEDGEGLTPCQIAEAVSAVIEPLGFEIDRILVADDGLRRAMRCERAVGLSHAADFDGRSGLCMINLREGYSHAFYWERMDAARFTKDQFRMALMVRRIEP